ncbi:MAG TPA: DNA-directed RNA polymerase subunit beta', partial [Chitinophagales bacterium]|nr:DNA-directed RNA polymerase subunit beta' [Chitinophagales bacterium]
RSVIVVGPELKLHECGLPKDMAAELFKPFIIRKLIERGIVKTVKSAKKLVDKKEPVIWDILENVLKGHPVLLNRAPTLHRLSIQAFLPKLIEGKAIQLHPLVCTAFNADFDGDQMAVHVPLSNASILEAQLLMLASHNILNPQNGTPITLPSQDMVLGLYYMTKEKRSTADAKVKGEGLSFYGNEEAVIAYNEGKVELHAPVKCRVRVKDANGKFAMKLIDTTMGRLILNQVMPEQVGYVNKMLGKKQLKDVIGNILAETNIPTTAKFLDDIKKLGFFYSFKGGLSFNLRDVVVPTVKDKLVAQATEKVDEIHESYQMGFITDKERFNQVVDIWTATDSQLTIALMKQIAEDKQGFNSIFMMLDSGARGSKQQIKQLSGMRGLMAKPRKSGSTGSEVIENPILANFKEGLSVLEYFISTHGARKGLSDTALKTADAGYLTRRLVDVAQDVVINEDDCGTLRGITISALKDNEDVVEPLYDRILGRTSLLDVYHPETDELLLTAGQAID